MKKLLDINDIETVADRIKRIMLADNNPALIVKDVVTLLGLIDELKVETNFTINEMRQYLTNIYQWLSKNDDLHFFETSLTDCSSKEVTQCRYNLEVALRATRPHLNKLAEAIDDLDICINQLKLSIAKEREEQKKAKREKKLRIKAASTHISATAKVTS